MSTSINTFVIPVNDIAKATAHYRALLGVDPHTETPYYVGFNVDGFEVGLNPNGHKSGMTGPTVYVSVEDIEGRFQEMLDAGAEAVQKPQAVGGGTTLATVKDADGNVVGLITRTSS